MSDSVTSEARRRGGDQYAAVMREAAPSPTSPTSAALLDFVFGEVWSRPCLSRRDRQVIAVACAAGVGDPETLAEHIRAALASDDLSFAELQEVVLHFAVYYGWPRARAFERVLDAEWRSLIESKGGQAPEQVEHPSEVPVDPERRTGLGEQVFGDVMCFPPPPRGLPYFDAILNYVFGDMWNRPGLPRRDRRWVTVACVGMSDTITPITSHVGAAMESGDIDYEDMHEFVLHFATFAGWPKASFLLQTVELEHARIVGVVTQQS